MEYTATKHDTGFVQTDNPWNASLTLTHTSAHAHLAARAKVEKIDEGTYTLPGVAAGAGLSILGLGAVIPVLTPELPIPAGSVLTTLGIVLAILGALAAATVLTLHVRQSALLHSLEDRDGVSGPFCLDVSKRVVAKVGDEVTPEMRDRLFDLIEEGYSEEVEAALGVLVEEAEQEIGEERQERRRAENEERDALVRRALGRDS